MSLWNPYAFTPTGQPVAPVAPPALRVIGGQASAQQLGMAQQAFVQFSERARLSVVPNPVEVGRLPDGTPYKIIDVAGVRTMMIWPLDATSIRSVVYLGALALDKPFTKFTFKNDGGRISYVEKTYAPYADDHPVRTPIGYSYSFGEYPYSRAFPSSVSDLSATGVFGSKDYFFLDSFAYGITNNRTILKPGNHFEIAPRKYGGPGYVAFSRTADKVLQDDGVVVHQVPEGQRIGNVSYHPKTAKVAINVVPDLDPANPHNFIVLGEAGPPSYYATQGPNATATYEVYLQINDLPSYPITRKEMSRQTDGTWAETSSEVIAPTSVPAEVPAGADFNFSDFYLRRARTVVGLVNFSKDTPVYSILHPNGEVTGEGQSQLEGSYRYAFETTVAETFDSAGRAVKIKEGKDRSLTFTSSMDVFYDEVFTPHSINHSSEVINQEWFEIEGERLYTINAQVKWSMASTADYAYSITNPDSIVAYYGDYEGSAELQVTCQRRQVLRYDPEMSFICYVEEQEFSYLWQPTASCAMLTGNGELATPFPGVPLDGTNEMVPVGEPVAYLVMKLRGKEVLREPLVFTKTDDVRTGMIPVTSAYFHPQLDELPPNYISLDEYKRRVRTLLCTNYQCGLVAVSTRPVGGLTERENRLRFTPYDTSYYGNKAQYNDFFLRMGAFQKIDWLRVTYINDASTLSGVMVVYSGVNFIDFEKTAYVITKNGVVKHELQPGQSHELQAT